MIALGSSEERLFIPVMYILHQRLLLGAEGIAIEEFY
jgi:hypothetical protein